MAKSSTTAGGGPTGPPSDEPTNSPIADFAEAQRRIGREPIEGRQVDTGGDDGEPPDSRDVRIAILETQVAHIQSALGEIRSDLKKVIDGVAHLPTKQDLFQNTATVVIIGLTVLAITVGGIVAGLGWLESKSQPSGSPPATASAPAPVIIQVPYPAAPLPTSKR
jgi:hypothetical protein